MGPLSGSDLESPLVHSVASQDNAHSRNSWYLRARAKAHDLVEGAIDTYFEYALLFVIFLNVVLLIASTVVVESNWCAAFDEEFGNVTAVSKGSKCLRLGDKYETFFEAAEWTSVGIFTVEYVLRIWACMEFPWVEAHGPLFGRLRYALTFFPLVDLCSIAPNLISLFLKEESPDFTTAARIVRLVRVFKTDKYINAFGLLGKVLYDNRVLLVASSFYALLCWVISASLLFFTEVNNPALGEHFQSIPEAMFPTLLMLTGEYPMADFTPIGKVIAGFVAVVAVAVFAIPTGVLGSGFLQAVQESMGRQFTVDVD